MPIKFNSAIFGVNQNGRVLINKISIIYEWTRGYKSVVESNNGIINSLTVLLRI